MEPYKHVTDPYANAIEAAEFYVSLRNPSEALSILTGGAPEGLRREARRVVISLIRDHKTGVARC